MLSGSDVFVEGRKAGQQELTCQKRAVRIFYSLGPMPDSQTLTEPTQVNTAASFTLRACKNAISFLYL